MRDCADRNTRHQRKFACCNGWELTLSACPWCSKRFRRERLISKSPAFLPNELGGRIGPDPLSHAEVLTRAESAVAAFDRLLAATLVSA